MILRAATKNDIPAILELIHELAIYEKEPDAVKTTAEDLLRDGFGDRPLFECQVAELEGAIEGFALYFYTWSTWQGRPSLYLEDLFVRDSTRGHGLGKALLMKLAQIAVEKKCQRFEWSVLDWNDLARNFYHSLGAQHMKGWLPYRVDGQALLDLAAK